MTSLVEILAGPVMKIIDKVIPDPQARQAAQLEILRMQQAGEFKEIDTQLQRDLAQIEVNKQEAAAPDIFRGGWRPGTGWVCVFGLAYQFIVQPLLTWASSIWAMPAPPALDLGDLIVILAGMLGLGKLRSDEKRAGVT